jgi:hypothetical protein
LRGFHPPWSEAWFDISRLANSAQLAVERGNRVMNHGLRIKLPVLPLMVFVMAVFALTSGTLPSASPIGVDETASTLSTLSKYRTWTLVNPAPVKMEPAVAQLCAAVVRDSPHRDRFVSVYVNEAGREAMMTRLRPKFPRGSVIIKEKLSDEGGRAPELLTAMVKHEEGYNPGSGDWEYLVLDGSVSKIEKRGKLSGCSGCHVAYRDTDYVTRTYLPDEVRRRLR